MASTVQEKDIKKLQEAGYLAKKIGHRLPTAGQIVPNPEPHERVVFLPHFVRGLGFPLHPFVRGIMYYYGILINTGVGNPTAPPIAVSGERVGFIRQAGRCKVSLPL